MGWSVEAELSLQPPFNITVPVWHMQVRSFIYEVTIPIIIEMQGIFELWAQLWMLQPL
jgi:hypothetical protein